MILLWSATEKSDTLFWATLWRFGENVLSLLSKISRRLAQHHNLHSHCAESYSTESGSRRIFLDRFVSGRIFF